MHEMLAADFAFVKGLRIDKMFLVISYPESWSCHLFQLRQPFTYHENLEKNAKIYGIRTPSVYEDQTAPHPEESLQ